MVKHMNLVGSDGKVAMDSRMNGHPFIVLNDVTDFGSYVICLKCSSKKSIRKRGFYIIKDFKVKGYPKMDTYVDIKNVYRIKITSFVESKGKISDDLLKKLTKLTQNAICK